MSSQLIEKGFVISSLLQDPEHYSTEFHLIYINIQSSSSRSSSRLHPQFFSLWVMRPTFVSSTDDINNALNIDFRSLMQTLIITTPDDLH